MARTAATTRSTRSGKAPSDTATSLRITLPMRRVASPCSSRIAPEGCSLRLAHRDAAVLHEIGLERLGQDRLNPLKQAVSRLQAASARTCQGEGRPDGAAHAVEVRRHRLDQVARQQLEAGDEVA